MYAQRSVLSIVQSILLETLVLIVTTMTRMLHVCWLQASKVSLETFFLIVTTTQHSLELERLAMRDPAGGAVDARNNVQVGLALQPSVSVRVCVRVCASSCLSG